MMFPIKLPLKWWWWIVISPNDISLTYSKWSKWPQLRKFIHHFLRHDWPSPSRFEVANVSFATWKWLRGAEGRLDGRIGWWENGKTMENFAEIAKNSWFPVKTWSNGPRFSIESGKRPVLLFSKGYARAMRRHQATSWLMENPPIVRWFCRGQ